MAESDEERDARFAPGNDRIWGDGNWVRCSTCPPDHEGRQVYHHKDTAAHDALVDVVRHHDALAAIAHRYRDGWTTEPGSPWWRGANDDRWREPVTPAELAALDWLDQQDQT